MKEDLGNLPFGHFYNVDISVVNYSMNAFSNIGL